MRVLHSQNFTAMGTACAVHVYATSVEVGSHAARMCEEEVRRIESRYSRYRDDSTLSRINHAAAWGGEIEVDEETSGILDYAWAMHDASEGLFDISSGVLRRAWDFRSGRIPSNDAIEAVLPLVGLPKIVRKGRLLRFTVPGMELDLGGVAKEYAADRAVRVARGLGIEHGLVDLGGDIAIIGPHPDGSAWRVAIQHPGQRDQIIGEVSLRGALATSGDYERCITHEGRRYSHILDPRTGRPVSGVSTVSVIADECLVAGSLSTLAMLRGAEGPAWLAHIGVAHLCVDSAGICTATPPFVRADPRVQRPGPIQHAGPPATACS